MYPQGVLIFNWRNPWATISPSPVRGLDVSVLESGGPGVAIPRTTLVSEPLEGLEVAAVCSALARVDIKHQLIRVLQPLQTMDIPTLRLRENDKEK